MHGELDPNDIKTRVERLRNQYKPTCRGADWSSDVFRVIRLYRDGGTLVDFGGGISAHNGVLAQLGMTVYVVDILDDYWEHKAAPLRP